MHYLLDNLYITIYNEYCMSEISFITTYMYNMFIHPHILHPQ